MSQGVDIYIVYEIVKRLTTPFEEMAAYKQGIIDEKGKLLKKPRSSEEKKAYTLFDRLIVNIKRLLSKLPGGESRVLTFAGALYLLREHDNTKTTEQQVFEIVDELKESQYARFNQLNEDIANIAGGGNNVAGLGDNPPVFAKRNRGRPRQVGRYINGVAFLKRKSKERLKQAQQKE